MLSVAAVVLVTVLGAGALGEVLAGRGGTAVSTTTTTTTAEGVAATADLRGDADGTAIDLSIRGVPAGERCRLLVLDRTGRPQVVSEWQVDYGGTASVHATTAVAPAELTGLRVVTVGGTGLADLTIRART
jgi:RNA polymerase sigma-70 factor (ECF subfamily)